MKNTRSVFLSFILLGLLSSPLFPSGLDQGLVEAIQKNDVKAVKRLLSGKADIKSRNEDGYTILMFAVNMGNPDVVKALVGAGADVKAVTSTGKTALAFAMEGNHAAVADLLTKAGAGKS